MDTLEEIVAYLIVLSPLVIWFGVEIQNRKRWVRIFFGLLAIFVVNISFFSHSIKAKDAQLEYCRHSLVKIAEAVDQNDLTIAKSFLTEQYLGICG
jgi:hypothetical protein